MILVDYTTRNGDTGFSVIDKNGRFSEERVGLKEVVCLTIHKDSFPALEGMTGIPKALDRLYLRYQGDLAKFVYDNLPASW